MGHPLDILRGAYNAFSQSVSRTVDLVSAPVLGLGESIARARTNLAHRNVGPQLDDAFVPEGVLAYAVGDIHGRADLLLRMIDMLRDDALQAEDVQGRPVLIFLGDYIDRGFQSKAVIDTLNGPAVSDFDTRFLRGNHEAAFLHFLSDSEFGPKWANYGGIETLVSYSVRPPSIRTDEAEWERVRDDLSKALPQGHLAFLQGLENQITLGDYEFVHAGVAPNVALDQQVEDDLLWIRDEFLLNKKRLERVIVHGHTPEAAPYRDNRRIGLDTGAYMSGRLTAARFQGNNVRFLSTT